MLGAIASDARERHASAFAPRDDEKGKLLTLAGSISGEPRVNVISSVRLPYISFKVYPSWKL